MKQRLVESFSVHDHKHGSEAALELLQSSIRVYDGSNHRYADLAVWLGFLRALGMIHHSHHWQTMGDSFYGDHLLFERLYKTAQDELDTVGEKIAGIDSPALTNYFLQLTHMRAFMKKISDRDKSPILVSVLAEFAFIATGEAVMARLEQAGLLTRGVENMMGDILDRHESHIYLLQQRLALNS